MIVRKYLSIKRIIQITWIRVLFIVCYSTLVCISFLELYIDHLSIPTYPGTILGIAVSILLGFRNNSAYDRWWEARRLWGAIVNDSRSLTRQVLAYTNYTTLAEGSSEKELVTRFVHRLVAFCYAAKAQLRKQEVLPQISPFITPQEIEALSTQKNIVVAILQTQGYELQKLRQACGFGEMAHTQMDARLTALCDSLGGCERIKNTVFPRQYSYFSSIFTWVFMLLLPHMMVEELHWFTIPLSFTISFVFLALERVGGYIENPFENTINDTPMSSICRTIEINLRQMLGEKELPPAEEPINGFLF